MIFFLLLLLSLFLGLSFCVKVLKNDIHLPHYLLLNLSIPIGIGLSSTIFFCLNILHVNPIFILASEILLTGYFLYDFIKRNNHKSLINKSNFSKWNISTVKIILLFITTLYIYAWIMNAGIFFFDSVKEPHGLWDAYNYWNLKAKFINRAPEHWPQLFHQMISEDFHLDYPLLQTGYIAYGWSYLKNETVWVPIITSFIFTFCTIGLLTSAVTLLTTKTKGLIAGLILLCTPFYMTMGDSQYADNTVGFFFLATVALLSIAHYKPTVKKQLFIIAGITAGLSAWSKNEGLLFIACLLLAKLILLSFKNSREVFSDVKYILFGILPVLTIILYYKMAIAPANDIIKAQGEQTFAKLTDYSRYVTVTNWYKNTLGTFGKWIINPWWIFLGGILYKGINIKGMNPGTIASIILLFLMLIGFFFIYIITPLNLEFHLSTSLHRLFFQLFPTFLFLYFISLGNRTSKQ